MASASTIPLLLGLGARVLLNSFSRPALDGYGRPEISIGEYVVQGLWQGALVHYVFSEYSSYTIALSLGLLGRLLYDFATFNNSQKLISTLLGAGVGFFAANVLTQLLEEIFGDAQSPTDELSDSQSRPTQSDRRGRSGRLSRRREPSVPRPVESRSTREQSVPFSRSHITDESTSTLDMMGYNTGLGRVIDMELGNLRKKAATAEADRRRCKEERKWALAQGNKARASQLSWQIKRYAAMVESYTREADRRIIEGNDLETRNRRAPTSQPFRYGHEQRYQEENRPRYYAHDPSEEQARGNYTIEDEARQRRLDKGKTPIRTIEDFYAAGLDRPWAQPSTM